ncbi:MAG: hypothetical protein ACK4Y9_10540 [Hyphomonas sp.]
MLLAHQIGNKELEVTKAQADFLDQCHIYLICSRPNLWYKPDNLRIINTPRRAIVSGYLCKRASGNITEQSFHLIIDLEIGTSAKLGEYPFRNIVIVDDNDCVVRTFPATLAAQFRLPFSTYSDCKVLYVGQALGDDGKRSALTRLARHSTLQRIFADTLHTDPDSEIVAVLANYENAMIFTQFDGSANASADPAEEDQRLSNVLDHQPDLKQVVCLAEASLIRYFRPKYNEVYKEHFPKASQKILNDCFRLDFAAITCEIVTSELCFRLHSDAVGAGQHHIKQFMLHDPDQRRTFSTFVDNDGTYHKIDISGPVY